ncbi:hypothetical protein DITRI_Ditri18aG0055200 [Diplodiscus trichospermus]
MAKRKAKKAVNSVRASAESEEEGNDEKRGPNGNKVGLIDQEGEQQCAAIRAVRDVEIEHTLAALRLLRSYCSEEQLQTPALQIFNENLPNLSLVRNAENGQFEVQRKREDGNFSVHNADKRGTHASFQHLMSIDYTKCHGIPSFGGLESSTEAARTNFLRAERQQIKDFVCCLFPASELGK